MPSKRRKTNSKRDNDSIRYTFSRCRECGVMVNCQTEPFIVTAARDTFCTSCYHGVGWQNLKKPYENHTESRTFKKKRFRDDE